MIDQNYEFKVSDETYQKMWELYESSGDKANRMHPDVARYMPFVVLGEVLDKIVAANYPNNKRRQLKHFNRMYVKALQGMSPFYGMAHADLMIRRAAIKPDYFFALLDKHKEFIGADKLDDDYGPE